MNSYILTAGGRKVTPTPRPLFPDDVLVVAPSYGRTPEIRGFMPGSYIALLDHVSGFLEWVRH